MIQIRAGVVSALLMATVVGVSGCGATRPAGIPASGAPSADASLALGGTSWRIVKIDEAGRVYAVPATANATITFGRTGEASGSDSVNNWSGRYSVHGQRIHFTSVATTLVGLTTSAPAYQKATMRVVTGIMTWGWVTATRAGSSLNLRLGSGSISLRRTGPGGANSSPSHLVSGAGATSPALQAWSTFPVTAVPRPVVLVAPPIIDPASGFTSTDDKLAYVSGGFDLSTRLPSVTTTASGRRIMTATAALDLLKSNASGNKSIAGHRLEITKVKLGSAKFATDRGRQLLPAWVFSFRGVAEPALVLALPGADWWPKGGATSDQVVDQSSASPDGRRVTISFTGAAAGSGPCQEEYTADIAQSTTAVLVSPRALPHPQPTGDVFCSEVGYRRTVTVTLTTPLGNRVLLTPVGSPLRAR